jgi:hypothetical protein
MRLISLLALAVLVFKYYFGAHHEEKQKNILKRKAPASQKE